MGLSRRALAIVVRLVEARARDPKLDRARAGAAIAEHFDRLGVPPLPLRWVADPHRAYQTAWQASTAQAGGGSSALETAASWSAQLAARSGERATVEWAQAVASASGERAPRAGIGPRQVRRTHAAADWRAENAAWGAAFGAASAGAIAAPRRRSSTDGSVGRIAVELAGWAADECSRESDRILDVWLPFVEAYEAGMGFFWVLEREVLAVARPALRVESGRLHCPDGPAVIWPDGPRLWFWRGVHVRRQVVERSQTLRAEEIAAVPNAKVRRVMLERFGIERYVREVGAEPVQQDDWGKLWRAAFRAQAPSEGSEISPRYEPAPVDESDFGALLEERARPVFIGAAGAIESDETIQMVEVANSTPEPDGSYRHYMLRVPPDVRTAREAVAWSFGLDPDDYQPTTET